MNKIAIKLYICEECDACWDSVANIEATTFQDLSTYLDVKGISYKEANIEMIGYQW